MSLKMNEDKDKVDDNEKKKAKTNERQYIYIFLLCISKCNNTVPLFNICLLLKMRLLK